MKKTLIIPAFLAGTVAVHADSIFQASLIPDIALHPRTTQINGFLLNIWGENPQTGVALGFINGSTDDSSGISLGLLNYSEFYSGFQWGIVNYNSRYFLGWQIGWVNWNHEYFKGLQWGLVNVANDAHGLQLGWFNYAQKLSGVQIGLVNIIKSNGWFDRMPDKLSKGFVLVNWSF